MVAGSSKCRRIWLASARGTRPTNSLTFAWLYVRHTLPTIFRVPLIGIPLTAFTILVER